MLLIIISTGDVLFSGVYIDDLKRLWTPKIRGFVNFFAIFKCGAQFKSDVRRTGWR